MTHTRVCTLKYATLVSRPRLRVPSTNHGCATLKSEKYLSRHPRATGTAITDHAPPEERAQSKRSVDIGRPRFGGRGPARDLRSALAGAALS